MAKPRYTIGIDLGTTNCALAYCDLTDKTADSHVFTIPQYVSSGAIQHRKTLPSFIYFLGKAEQKAWAPLKEGCKRVVGIFAKEQAALHAARVAYCAKSWLCHRAVDAYSKILPWGSDALTDKEKSSSLEASALYLSYLKDAWDEAFKAKGEAHLFGSQKIVVTVPASFDIVSQEMTLEAAKMAGFPEDVALLEEPQAAFYRWLESQKNDSSALEKIEHLLVCDVGGGTSDFSLFQIESKTGNIKRIAVSDHILLGGDNIDLAFAHYVEPQLRGEEGLSTGAWTQLVAQCRALKERALSSDDASMDQNELLHIALAGAGASLFKGSKSAQVDARALRGLIEEGFFPECSIEDKPCTSDEGFRELGLPYARDSGITKHLAAFLQGYSVDTVLFNGGCLKPKFLRERLLRIVSRWQGKRVIELANPELDLAVARGAAFYGKQKNSQNVCIEAKLPYSFYIEVDSKDSKRSMVCLLPTGADTGVWYDLQTLSLRARINRPVQFRVFYSHKKKQDKLGAVCTWDEADFLPLPPLETIIQLRPGSKLPANNLLKIQFKAKVTALGLLEIYTASDEPAIAQGHEWKLTFNLRKGNNSDKPTGQTCEKYDEQLRFAQTLIREIFLEQQKEGLKPNRLMGALEEAWGIPRGDWPLDLLRQLWPILYPVITKRNRSPLHECVWLYTAGFCLRPGYGSPWDSFYIDELWRLHELGLFYPKDSNVVIQQAILWRRVAGGLDGSRQEKLIKKYITQLKGRQPEEELIRMCASMERVGIDYKKQIFNLCLERARFSLKLQNNPYLWALGRLLNRVPLYAGPEHVMPEEYVSQAFDALKSALWDKQLQALFMRAGRLSGERTGDISQGLRDAIILKLEKSKAESLWIEPLKEYQPVREAEAAQLFGDALPLGLVM